MCGLVGFANPFKDVSSFRNVLNNMNNEIAKRGPDEDGMYFEENVCLGHKRLIVIDPDGGKQPMIFRDQGNTYSLVYNGQIYNTKELKDELSENGFTFDGHSDTEVLLKGFSFWKYDIIHKLNGIFSFAIWNSKEKELFVARDHFGVKPFYYSIVDGTFVFASEVKALFKYPGITAKIDSEGISELFGLGPSHTPGHGIFKDIHELKPASYGVFNSSGLHVEKYWSLVSLPHKDSFGTTCDKVRFLLEDSIRRQLVSDVPLCTFLSGGLDSSIITLYAANYCKEKGLPPLNTYSVDYVDNDKNFVKTDFQPNSDNYYINLMKNKLNTNHHSIILDTPELADSLEDAMLARDYPGMADVDSSLLLFCKMLKSMLLLL